MNDADDTPQFLTGAGEIPQDWPRLAEHLAAHGWHLDDDPPPRQFASGFGNLNFLIHLDSEARVLRRPPLGPIQPGANDAVAESRILLRLWKAFPLAPRCHHFCDDPKILGAPFFIVEYPAGHLVIGGTMPDGLAADAGARLGAMMATELARFHAVDPADSRPRHAGQPRRLRRAPSRSARAESVVAVTNRRPIWRIDWLGRHVPDAVAPPSTLLAQRLQARQHHPQRGHPAPHRAHRLGHGAARRRRSPAASLLGGSTEAGDPPAMLATRCRPLRFPSREATDEAYGEASRHRLRRPRRRQPSPPPPIFRHLPAPPPSPPTTPPPPASWPTAIAFAAGRDHEARRVRPRPKARRWRPSLFGLTDAETELKDRIDAFVRGEIIQLRDGRSGDARRPGDAHIGSHPPASLSFWCRSCRPSGAATAFNVDFGPACGGVDRLFAVAAGMLPSGPSSFRATEPDGAGRRRARRRGRSCSPGDHRPGFAMTCRAGRSPAQAAPVIVAGVAANVVLAWSLVLRRRRGRRRRDHHGRRPAGVRDRRVATMFRRRRRGSRWCGRTPWTAASPAAIGRSSSTTSGCRRARCWAPSACSPRYVQAPAAGPADPLHALARRCAPRQDIGLDYARKREAFGKTIGKHEGVGFMLADNEMDLTQSRLQRAAATLDRGEKGRQESSMAKTAVSEALFRVTDRCVQVLGGLGVAGDTGSNRCSARSAPFASTTAVSEVHRWAIAGRVLGSTACAGSPWTTTRTQTTICGSDGRFGDLQLRQPTWSTDGPRTPTSSPSSGATAASAEARYSFAEMAALSRRFANLLAAHGVEKGDRHHRRAAAHPGMAGRRCRLRAHGRRCRSPSA